MNLKRLLGLDIRSDEYAYGVDAESGFVSKQKVPDAWVPTTCGYCSVGCGMLIGTKNGRAVSVRGNAAHPVNEGWLCPKGLSEHHTLAAANRARHPLLKRDGKVARISWPEALRTMAVRFRAVQDQYGRAAVGVISTGQLVTEEFYTLGKLVQLGLGTRNYCGNTTLCMSTAVSGYKRSFGSDGPPGAYEDFDQADLILLIGANIADNHPILCRRVTGNAAATLIVVDPRVTKTAMMADLHLPIRPRSDLALINGLLHIILKYDLVDAAYIERHTTGIDELRASVESYTPQRVAELTGLSVDAIYRTASLYANARAAIIAWTMGVNHSTKGTETVNAINNLALVTGQIGRPGAGPFSITGQCNAMGTREAGFTSSLPGYRPFEDASARQDLAGLWNVSVDRIPTARGLAYPDIIEAVLDRHIRALWIIGTNPIVSFPNLGVLRQALEGLDFLVVQDGFQPTPTSELAHLVLPAAIWGEKEGTYTNSERRVSKVNRAVSPPGEARADFDIFLDLATELGCRNELFPGWTKPEDAFNEWGRVSAGRLCDYSGMTYDEIERCGGIQWPCPTSTADPAATRRLYVDGRFQTADGRARLLVVEWEPYPEQPNPEFPLVLNTGRTVEHWHTRTKTGQVPILERLSPEAWVEMNPKDARTLGLKPRERVDVVSRRGRVRGVELRLTETVAPGQIFVPFHYPEANANQLTQSAFDPISREPNFKQSAVRVERGSGEDGPVALQGGTTMTRLVVVGNGMAGARVVEEILQRAPRRFDIVMFGAEPYGNYNRILLSNVLNGSQSAPDIFMNPLSWYRDNGITLHAGVRALRIDRERRVVVGTPLHKSALAYAADAAGDDDAALVEAPYDRVIIATGARPFVPPMEGFDGPGTFLFRTIDDCARIADHAKGCRRAAVIGGGLLGLEAARGLLTHEVEVTVLEAAPQLMMAQLDHESGDMLRATIGGMGIKVLSEAVTTRIVRTNGRISHLELKNGSRVETDMVVVSAGIRPITEIATASGLTVNRGIVCNDQMQTNDPAVFALGECVEHRGTTYGLVDPIWEMARVLADVMTGTNPDAAYGGSKLATKLKVMGVELASMGETRSASAGDEVVVYREPRHGIYKKLVVRNDKIVGAILLGETEAATTLTQMFMAGSRVPARRADLLFGSPTGVGLLQVSDLPDNAQICNCNGVSKRQIVDAIETKGCHSVSKVAVCTKAGLGCGSCKSLVAQLLEGLLGEVGYDPSEHYYVPGVPLEKSQLVAEIKSRRLKSVSAVFEELAGGKEDAGSKAGLASLLKTLWPNEYDDERDARFINDRVHANIQKDGTFSVVPRIYAGVTTPDELMRIAQVAVKYNVPTVKITGGQRIDLLGIKKADLPGVWKDLGMPSGHAYTKSFRTCKSCVGTDFCRYGVGDSIALAQKIERRFQGVESPHKMKLATAGCPRNCSEAYVKDLGAVAIDGGQWEIYLGGAAGGSVRKGDLLCTVSTHDEVLMYMGRFIQYYREHGRYLERTYHFVERIGIENLRKILLEDSLGIAAQLDAGIQKAVDAYVDPWVEAELPAYHAQFSEAELAYTLEVAESNG